MRERLCVCPDPDPRRCYDLREYGYTPVNRGQPYREHHYVMQETLTWAELDDYECPCVCHSEDEGEEAGDGGV